MRRMLGAMLSIAVLLPMPALAQVGVEIGPGGVRVRPQPRQYYEERPVVRDPEYARMARRCRFMVDRGEYDSWRECMDDNGF